MITRHTPGRASRGDLPARDHPDLPLQKAGHGSLVETGDGHWYLAYLVARPHGRRGPCVLGRETALAPVTWTADGRPRTETGLPAPEVPAPDLPPGPGSADHADGTDGFDGPVLGPQWSTLRRPAGPDWLSLTERTSHLRLRGGRSPQSLIGPSLVARRLTAARRAFEATMDYRPLTFQHLAGITAYYNTGTWYQLHVTADDAGEPVLRVAACDRGRLSVDEAGQTRLSSTTRLRLGLDVDGAELRFRHDTGSGWEPFGPVLDATALSDEHAEHIEDGLIRSLGFTGAFAGLWAWDLTGGGHHADFDEVTYRS
ncbi:family 43 glycosylhydrolase [Streptomyces massasporeus]|uniref:beta-xylosidase family glycoside hydrolase n=1 Tax=Streptomyces massasporeus TaxID=67324 RepID=UPI00382D144A